MEFDEKKFGIELVPAEKDTYSYYRGRFAEIQGGGNSYYGIYRGTNQDDDLILFPFLRSEIYEDAGKTKKSNGQRLPDNLLLMNEPAFIHLRAVIAVIPVREEYLQYWVEKGKPKIILP